MPAAIYPALFFTVALLFVTAYFLLGGLPLLILKHDVPLDARFIRGFFIGAAAIAIVATLLRMHLVRAMHQLGIRIEANDERAIQQFRRMHGAALLVNLAQL